MKKTLLEKRIPTLFGMLLIIVGITLTSVLVKRGTSFLGFAAPSSTPENIRIANITDTSFTVSYTTSNSTTGSVSFGTTEALGNTALDVEDELTKNVIDRKTHVISLKNLKPSTAYYFAIINGDTTFLNNEKPFTALTAPVQETPSEALLTIDGKILFPDNINAEALVYITSENSQPLVARTKPDGSYTFPTIALRAKDLGSSIVLKENDILRMLVIGSVQQSNITLFASQTHPVPTIILSKNYDFTLNTTPIATASATFGFPSFSASPSAIKTPQIVSPKKNESFVDAKPLFKGVASPSATVEIEIHSDEQIKTEVVADKNGAWTFRPTKPLTPGTHTLRITTRDVFGIVKTITQSFTVYAQGSQVGQSATPSATLVPTKAPTPTAFLNPLPTTTPTVIVITQIPTPTTIIIPTNIPVPPTEIQSPGSTSAILIGIGAITTVVVGVFLLLFARGGVI